MANQLLVIGYAQRYVQSLKKLLVQLLERLHILLRDVGAVFQEAFFFFFYEGCFWMQNLILLGKFPFHLLV